MSVDSIQRFYMKNFWLVHAQQLCRQGRRLVQFLFPWRLLKRHLAYFMVWLQIRCNAFLSTLRALVIMAHLFDEVAELGDPMVD